MRIVGRLYLLGNIQQADIGFGISLLSSGDNPQIALKECLEIVGSQVLHLGSFEQAPFLQGRFRQ